MEPSGLKERFDAKWVEMPNGCWEWTAARKDDGYGQFRVGSRQQRAHRVAYELYVGMIPDGLELDHLCKNPSCVNPKHLEPVTHQVNMVRSKGRSGNLTHCVSGHELSGNNLIVRKTGYRSCRTCQQKRQREYKRRVRNGA